MLYLVLVVYRVCRKGVLGVHYSRSNYRSTIHCTLRSTPVAPVKCNMQRMTWYWILYHCSRIYLSYKYWVWVGPGLNLWSTSVLGGSWAQSVEHVGSGWVMGCVKSTIPVSGMHACPRYEVRVHDGPGGFATGSQATQVTTTQVLVLVGLLWARGMQCRLKHCLEYDWYSTIMVRFVTTAPVVCHSTVLDMHQICICR